MGTFGKGVQSGITYLVPQENLDTLVMDRCMKSVGAASNCEKQEMGNSNQTGYDSLGVRFGSCLLDSGTHQGVP